MDYYNNFPMSENVKKCRAFAHQMAIQNRNKSVEPIHMLYNVTVDLILEYIRSIHPHQEVTRHF